MPEPRNDWVPLVGHVDVVVLQASPVAIHGDPYLDLLAAPEGGRPTAFRVPAHQFGPAGIADAPSAGDRVRLHLLMSQVDRVEPLAEA